MSQDITPPISAAADIDVDPSAKAYGVPVRVVPDGQVADDIAAIKASVASIDAGIPAALGVGGGEKVEGVGTAGSPTGGVASVQGVATGTSLPTIRRPATLAADSTSFSVSGVGALLQKQDGIKTSAGTLHSVLFFNGDMQPRWVYVYDNTTATGTVIHVEQVPGRSPASGLLGFGASFFEFGRHFSIGLSWAASTTPPGTAFSASTADIYAETEYT